MQIELTITLFQETHSFMHILFNVVFLVPENLNSTTLQINQIYVKLFVVGIHLFLQLL